MAGVRSVRWANPDGIERRIFFAMNPTLLGVLVVVGMFFGMLIVLEFGRRLGEKRLAENPETAQSGSGAIEGAVFGLMALLVAFTFSSAATRFDLRRTMIVTEANNIETAWLRLDLLPVPAQPPLREKFRQYLDARLAIYAKFQDLAAARIEMNRASALQIEIWKEAVAACRDSGSSSATSLLLPALNDMFNITTTRTMAAQTHAPLPIYVVLGLVMLAVSLLAGYGMANGKTRNRFHAFAFALIMCLAIYVILDFEFPRFGLIRVDSFDAAMQSVRQSMNP
jgi:hypothetical protein